MELIQQELKFYIPSTGKMSGFSESTDVIIPDSFPDFDEAVFSCATINVKDELKQPGRLLISGQIDAVILYHSSEAENLFRLNIPLSFAHVEDTKDLESNALHFIRYSVSQVETRIVNSRKINVTCTCIIEPKFFQHASAMLTTGIHEQKPDLQIKTRHQTLPAITAAETGRFVILDDLELSKHTDDVPLHTEVGFRNVDCSVVNGRVILNGAAHLRIWESSTDTQVLCHAHEIPFHQVLETSNLCQDAPTRVELSCHSVICHYSNADILSVNINTEAVLWQETEQHICWIEDLYDLTQDLQASFQPVSITSIKTSGSFNCGSTETITTPHNVSEILSTELCICSFLPSNENEQKAILSCSILYRDEDRSLHQLQKQLTTTFTSNQGDLINRQSEFVCTAEASAQGKQILLRTNASGKSNEKSVATIQNLTEVLATPCDKLYQRPLKILYLRDAASLWQIAKENRSTIHAIQEYNSLPENVQEISGATLLIP